MKMCFNLISILSTDYTPSIALSFGDMVKTAGKGLFPIEFIVITSPKVLNLASSWW